MGDESAKLKQYLLGNLSQEAAAEIDLRIIEDDALTEHLALAESDLIEDYLEGSLSTEELALFNSNFLTSADRKQQLGEISLLKRYARDQAGSVAPAGGTSRSAGFSLAD